MFIIKHIPCSLNYRGGVINKGRCLLDKTTEPLHRNAMLLHAADCKDSPQLSAHISFNRTHHKVFEIRLQS